MRMKGKGRLGMQRVSVEKPMLKMDREEKENCNETAFEDKLYWWDHEFETVIGKDDKVEGSKEHVGKEIDGYSKEKSISMKRIQIHLGIGASCK
ncbi:hypothetical protein TIFTF001_046096 [Ficus carica]|uniref:Uncharacterized protein n=1 Tax=Ficus carica TaxID=3494 RepID=A0AA88CR78_FICCA|nr:hypothetical protein TIFTF001_046096 [Ficus carica]